VNKYNTSSNNNTDFSYGTNNQNNNNQNFTDSINRSLDQTKDNINRSIEESKNQIPHYNTIVNSYQEQALQTVKEISENYIESQKSIISSIQSAWRPYQQNLNNKVNTCMSPEAAVSAYSRFVSTVADNTVTALRTTNNMIFSNLDSWKSTLQQARDNSKQIFNLNSKTAKTFEQNAKELARAAQDTASQNNASYHSRGGDNTNTITTSTPAGTTSSTTTSKSNA
jgi:flagellar biosynthesis chaperone FliJ